MVRAMRAADERFADAAQRFKSVRAAIRPESRLSRERSLHLSLWIYCAQLVDWLGTTSWGEGNMKFFDAKSLRHLRRDCGHLRKSMKNISKLVLIFGLCEP
jgi:hypothetical protein